MFNKTKYYILKILSSKKELSSIKIHNYLKKNGHSKSYQNTFKILQEMVKNQELNKKERLYEINIKKLEEIVSSIEAIIEDYKVNSKKIKYVDKRTKIITFNSLLELDYYWADFVIKEVMRNEENISEIFWEGPNCWWLFVNLYNEEKFISFLKGKNIDLYFKIKEKNNLNHKTKEFYNKRGSICKIKPENSEKKYLHRGICGNKIIEIEYPNEINKMFDEIYSFEESNIFVEKINEIVNANYRLNMKVYEDRELAKYFSEQIKNS